MNQRGFTLIETLVAIFILTLTVGGLLTLAAGGYFSVRYARNQIVANNLLQESIEYIRNSRDTATENGQSWQTWVSTFTNNGCMATGNYVGCIVDPYTNGNHIQACGATNKCPYVTFYPTAGFYGYAGSNYPSLIQSGAAPYLTSYRRTITMQQSADQNQLVITVTVQWLNGNTPKTAKQSILMTNWSVE